jgi:hypothetical protein
VACIVANRPIGPKEYVRFAYHVVEWGPGQPISALASSLSPDKPVEHMDFSEKQ